MEDQDQPKDQAKPEGDPTPVAVPKKKETSQQRRARIRNEKLKAEIDKANLDIKIAKGIHRYRWSFDRDVYYNDLAIEFAMYQSDKLRARSNTAKIFHLHNIFKIVWPEYKHTKWTKMLDEAWCGDARLIGVIGHTRASKTFHTAHLALIEWLVANSHISDGRAAITFTTTSFDALRTRLWGDLMTACESTPHHDQLMLDIKITSTSNELKLESRRESRADDRYSIKGIATDSADRSAGKIRGQHADRRIIIVDEAQDVAPAIYTAIMNANSATHFKAVLLSNPVEKISEFGNWVEPKDGWNSVTAETLHWETKKLKGICLHFDGLQSPNIEAGETVYPFLLTQQYVDEVREASGVDSLHWWMYIRGFFPPDGIVSRVWADSTIEQARKTPTFDFAPIKAATLDPAFEHDNCVLIIWEIGQQRDGKYIAYATKSVVLKTAMGAGADPKDYQIARQCIKICEDEYVSPDNFLSDETGNARGVIAIMRQEWSPKVQSVSYGGKPTDRPLRPNDKKSADQQVNLFVAELWFRASYLAQAGMISGLRNVDSRTEQDLSSRRFDVKKGLMVVEEKKEMKNRLGRSPDFGDSFCQIGELMIRNGLVAGSITQAIKGFWVTTKERAIKASARFSHAKEFTYAGD